MLYTAITSVLDNHKGQLQFVNSEITNHKELTSSRILFKITRVVFYCKIKLPFALTGIY